MRLAEGNHEADWGIKRMTDGNHHETDTEIMRLTGYPHHMSKVMLYFK